MAKRRKKVPIPIKRQLIVEAGNKCANPGCDSWRLHLHHIKHWAVYHAHNAEDMIAICPGCHDAVHHTGGISDETLYRWKTIERPNEGISRGHLYVEPSKEVISFLFVSSKPVFSVEASEKAWALVVIATYGHTFNPRPSYKLDSIYLTDASLLSKDRTAQVLKASMAKKLQKKMYDGKIEPEAAWHQVEANLRPYHVPEKTETTSP